MNRQCFYRYYQIGRSCVFGISLTLIFCASLFAAAENGGIDIANQTVPAFNCNNVTAIPISECNTLVDIYDSTGGDSWIDDSNWLVNNDPCTWFGISCSEGHIRAFNMSNNGLDGELPSLAKLSYLRSLTIFDTGLSGQIPQLDGLVNLEELALVSPLLTGTLPSLAGLTQLRSFGIASGKVHGNIPSLAGLSKLRALIINDTEISGEIPPLHGLYSLEILDLTKNRLTGELPSSKDLLSLNFVSVFGNKLSGDVPDLFCSKRVILNLNYNMIAPQPNCKEVYGFETQTVPPTEISASAKTDGTVILNWVPISYTTDGGYYEVLQSTTLDGEFTAIGETADKESRSFTITGLDTTSKFYFVIRTVTPQHSTPYDEAPYDYQPSDLLSNYSEIIEVAIPREPIAVIYLPAINR